MHKIRLSLGFIIYFLLLLTPTCFAKENSSVQVSAMIVDLTRERVLYEDQADLRLTPASTTKLFVAATALQQLGSNYQFITPVYVRGNVSNGILNGDLILYGKGDPALTNEKLWALANQLQQFGLKKVNGNIIVNTSYLGYVIPNDPDRVQAKISSEDAYNGLLSSAGSNFGTIGVSIFPARYTHWYARKVVAPFQLNDVTLSGKVLTTNNTKNNLKLIRVSKYNQEQLRLSGGINENSNPVTLYRAVGDPNLLTGNLLKRFMQQANISIVGKVLIDTKPLTSKVQLLSSIESEPLSYLLQSMLHNSNNYMADMLTLDMWRMQQKQNIQQTDLTIASQNLLAEYQKIKQHSAFNNESVGLPILYSGSGLTPNNKISARDFVILLDGMYHDARNFPILQGALTNLADASYWRKHLTHSQFMWAQRLMVKTGSMSHPVPTLALAGYFRMKNGNQGAFALLLNQPGTNDITHSQLPTLFIQKLDTFFNEY